MLDNSPRRVMFVLVAAALLAVSARTSRANDVVAQIKFDTEMVQMDLTGGPFLLPLAIDPGNSLGDSVDGYGFVDSNISFTLSSQRSVSPGVPTIGRVTAVPLGLVQLPAGDTPTIDPEALDGELFLVDSFFDVFFDVTVTDVDNRPGRNLAGLPDGARFTLANTGPGWMQSHYEVVFDKDAPNFGLFPPPEAAPWIGLFQIEIPLGGDLNGNGANDKIKIEIAALSAGDENRTFETLPDGTVLNEFNAVGHIMGLVVDETSDPPFTIGAQLPNSGLPDPAAFGGPATSSSHLQNPVLPEPATILLLSIGGMGIVRRRRKA